MLAGQGWHVIFGMPQIAVIMGCLVGCLIPIAGIIANYWYKAQKVRSVNELKRTMVDRGLSVDEIERILAAQAEEPRDSRR